MTTLPIIVLPQDSTASEATHEVVLEEHILPVRDVRALRPHFGAFFTKDFKLYTVDENNENTLLTKGVQYQFGDFMPETSFDIGQEVFANVLIKDSSLPARFKVSYRALGGETNAHQKNLIDAVASVIGAGAVVDFETGILGKPKGYNPAKHYTPGHTLYGLESITERVEGIRQALITTVNTQRAKVLEAGKQMQLTLQVKLITFLQTLNDHVRQVGNAHNDTADTIGLGLVSNRGFKEAIIQGVNQEGYASPSKTRSVAYSAIGNKVRIHSLNQNNPHNDTKATIGLGNVSNLPIHVGYNSPGGIGSFNLTYKNASLNNLIYVGAYSVKSFVAEYTASTIRTTGFDIYLNDAYDEIQIALANIAQTLESYRVSYLAFQPKITWIANKKTHVDLKKQQIDKEEKEYRLLSYNSCYAQLLKQIVLHRKTTKYTSLETTYPVPSNIRNLEFWLDFSDTSTLVTVGSEDNQTLSGIIDKSTKARVFKQTKPSAQPLYKASKDALVPNAAGITKNKVAVFTTGAQFLKQTAGTTLTLKPNSTLVMLVRTGADNSTLYPLMQASPSDASTSTDGIELHGANMQALLTTNDNRFKATLALNSTASQKYALVVLSLHATDTSQCWAASTKGSYSPTTSPKGLLDQTTLLTEGLVVNQIGINKDSADMQGEIAEIMYFNTQLSLREVQALKEYLSHKWSSTPTLSLDTAYVQDAFMAPAIV